MDEKKPVLTEGCAPPIPAEADLRGMEWMPLFGDIAFHSQTWIAASAEGKVAALRLWWHAYGHEVPAGSLPDDDTLLADYAGYGVAIKAWKKVKPQAMRGWVKCADGRLYHAKVAAIVADAWSKREGERARKRSWREAKDGDGTGTGRGRNGPVTVRATGTERGQDGDGTVLSQSERRGRNCPVPADRTGQDKEEERGSPSSARASPSASLHGSELTGLGDRVLEILGGDPTRIPQAYTAVNALISQGASPSLIEATARILAGRKGWKFKGFAYAMKALGNEVERAMSEASSAGKPSGFDDWPRWRQEHFDDRMAWARDGRQGPEPDPREYERGGGRPAKASAVSGGGEKAARGDA